MIGDDGDGVVGEAGEGEVTVETRFGTVRGRGRFLPGSAVTVGVRPELIGFAAADDPGANSIRARLLDVVFQGSRVQAHFASTPAEPILVESVGGVPPGSLPGAEMLLTWRPSDTLVLAPKGTA